MVVSWITAMEDIQIIDELLMKKLIFCGSCNKCIKIIFKKFFPILRISVPLWHIFLFFGPVHGIHFEIMNEPLYNPMRCDMHDKMNIDAVRGRLLDILYGKSFIYREDPPFKLVSGKESFYYFDCKATTLDPEGLSLIGKAVYAAVAEWVRNGDADAIGGLTLGADPISLAASLEAYRNGRTLYPLIVRKEPKKHGTSKWIEGEAGSVKKVIAVDDVITTGGSTITAVERMRESGFDVSRAVVLIDRQEGGGRISRSWGSG